MKTLNILLPTTGLDIGGAETHVTELAKQLKELGHQPVVMSSGGIYVEELKDYNIPHIECPLNSKKITSMIKSFNIFKEAIRVHQIDLIHSHGRVASLISGFVGAYFKIPFMTTAHALFTHNFPIRYLTVWGKEVISVSDDVKQHLIKNFKVEESRITVISNGINMTRFNPEVKSNQLLSEFNLSSESLKIVYVSRLTGPLADLAKKVISIAPKLIEKYKNVDIMIVGDGEDFQTVKSFAEEFQVIEGNIKIIGKRTDIPEILGMANVVIAVGRAALESMAMEKPVILAGGEGYMGVLTEGNYDLAAETNFTGRNIKTLESPQQLLDDITEILSTSSEEQQMRMKYLRDKMKKNYSVEEMTKKTVEVYKRLISK